jgi:hypothetical protein
LTAFKYFRTVRAVSFEEEYVVSLYSIALFLHVAGALALFAALALEWVGLAGLRRATAVEQVREWGGIWQVLPRIAPIAMATLLISGIYMTAVAWGRTAWWIGLGLAGMVFLGALGSRSARSLAGVVRDAAAATGPLSAAVRGQLADTRSWASVRIRVAVALGVVFLMTVRPGLAGSLITMGVAAVVGLVWARSAGRWSLEQRSPSLRSG